MVHSYFDAKLTQPDIDSSSSSDCENTDDHLDSIITSLLANLSIYQNEDQENMTIKKPKKDRNKHDRVSENDKQGDKVRNSNHFTYGATAASPNDSNPVFSLNRRQVSSIDNLMYPDLRLSQPSNAKRSRSLLPSDSVNNQSSFDRGSYKILENTFTENSGNNSEDEYYMATGSRSSKIPCQVEENQMSILLKEKKGWKIISVDSDGACLFRAVAHQIFGNEEEHKMIREQVINYMKKNREHFSQFISEDFDRYLLRKLDPHTHGNHIEIQAISELYNRPVEIYFNSLEPINVFHRECTDLQPIRLSYHGGIHYNSIVDPQNPTFGEGLGMPNYQPRLSESELLEKAKIESEQSQIEDAILQDKLKQSEYLDLERSIAEQVARQSRLEYLQTLKSKKSFKEGVKDSVEYCESEKPFTTVCSLTSSTSTSSTSASLNPSNINRKRSASPTTSTASCSYSSVAAAAAFYSDSLTDSNSTDNQNTSTTTINDTKKSDAEHDDYLIRHVPTNMLDMDEEAILAMVMENSRQEYINSHKNKSF